MEDLVSLAKDECKHRVGTVKTQKYVGLLRCTHTHKPFDIRTECLTASSHKPRAR